MIRQATQADLPQIEAVLHASYATTMFFRSNLHNAGLTGDYSRACEAIGFRRVGDYRIALFQEPWTVPQ